MGLLVEEKPKEDPPVPTPPNPGPPPKPVGESDMEVSLGQATQATLGKHPRCCGSGVQAGIKHLQYVVLRNLINKVLHKTT